MHLIAGLIGYKALGWKDKLAIVRLASQIKGERYTEPVLKRINTDELFAQSRQTVKAIR